MLHFFFFCFLKFQTLQFQCNYACRNTRILVNRMQFTFNLSYIIWTKNLVHGLNYTTHLVVQVMW